MKTWIVIGTILLVLSLMGNTWLYSTHLSQTSRLHDAAADIQELEAKNGALEYEIAVLENRIDVYKITWDRVTGAAKTIQSIGEYNSLAEFVLSVVIPTYPLKSVPAVPK